MRFAFDNQILELHISHVVNAGYAGCNQEAVQQHIEELAAIGVKVPKQTPTFYPVPLLQLTQTEMIQVGHDQTSAEVEYVILIVDGKRYLTIGSDHSDRALEVYSVNAAKQICPNIIADELWEFDAVSDHWDQIVLKCEVADAVGWRVYQEGLVTALLLPEQLLELGKSVIPAEHNGLALYSGTISTLGEITYGTRWRITMLDLTNGKVITKEYGVEILPECIE